MDSFNTQDAPSALNLLSEVALQREEEISAFNTLPDQGSSDEEVDSPYPYFDQFYEQGGNESIREMCNFTAREFELLWQIVETFVKKTITPGAVKNGTYLGKIWYSCFSQY